MMRSTSVLNHAHGDPFVALISSAQNMLKANRAQGLNALNDLFRSGTAPNPALNGFYSGELIALAIAPGLTQVAQMIASTWTPWKGKSFDPTSNQGDNTFHRSAFGLSHVLWPFYRGYRDDTPQTYRAFAFRTYVAPGKDDPDVQVFKLDYDSPDNPSTSIRRLLDEVVQVENGVYLGKVHLKLWWGQWQMVAYFGLRASA